MLSLSAIREDLKRKGTVWLYSIFYLKTMQKFNFDKDNASRFSEVPSADFIGIMLQGGARADEAAYYLLHHRINQQLKRRFEVYHNQLMDDFEDVLEDFFLYLREGKGGGNRTPYQSLQRIRKKEVFETWLINTFRNYLTLRAAEGGKVLLSGLDPDNLAGNDGIVFPAIIDLSASPLTDERILSLAADLIAYAHQTFNPQYRFILLRSLLSMLDRQQSLPNEEVAKALRMTDLSYRVTTHRTKCSLAKLRDRLLRGESLPLDSTHLQMARHINDDFTHLYPTLLFYYDQAIDMLPCAAAIKQLRQQYRETTGHTLHEPTASYSAQLTVTGFWNKLSQWVIV